MTCQNQVTQLDAKMESGVVSGLIDTNCSAAERKVAAAPIGGEQTLAASLTVTPVSGTLDISAGDTQQLKAVLVDQNGRSVDVSSQVVWSTANASIATVSKSGLVSPVGAGGPINITGSLHGQSDTYAVTVVA